MTPPRALGGYFELEIGATPQPPLHPGAIEVQSACAAVRLLLQGVKPARAWVPWYICETMADAARAAGVPVVRYGLREDFGVGADVELRRGDVLLYVNYFGLCDRQVDEALRRFPRGRVIVDDAHALYSPPRECLGTLYSPRKFVGVPDGGWLVTSRRIRPPARLDDGSLRRCLPRLARLADGPEPTYAEFLRFERELARQEPRRMSALTRRLLAAVDHAPVVARRKANFDRLDRALGKRNACPLRRDRAAVPFAFPFFGSATLRRELIAQRVYVSQFWPQLVARGSRAPEFERFLANDCLPLPCDQRCDVADLRRVIEPVS